MEKTKLSHRESIHFELMGWAVLAIGGVLSWGPVAEGTLVPNKYFVAIGMFAVFAFLGLYLILMRRYSNIEFDDEIIEYQSALKKKATIRWGDIKDVSFGVVSHELVISDGRSKVKAHRMIKNFNKLVEVVHDKVPLELRQKAFERIENLKKNGMIQ